MSDPQDILEALDQAEDAFEYIGGAAFEADIDQSAEWKTQLTKACRYLAASRMLRDVDGYNGSVVELCFGATERSLEAYLLWETGDRIEDFLDHEESYDRAAARGLLTQETAERLKTLYSANRAEHYYGAAAPTQEKEDAMFELAMAVHAYTTAQIREGGVCLCR